VRHTVNKGIYKQHRKNSKQQSHRRGGIPTPERQRVEATRHPRSYPCTTDHQRAPDSTEHSRKSRTWPTRATQGGNHPDACKPRAEQGGPTRPWLAATGPEEDWEASGGARVVKKPATNCRSDLERRRHKKKNFPKTQL
jgi:hypothetical protein